MNKYLTKLKKAYSDSFEVTTLIARYILVFPEINIFDKSEITESLQTSIKLHKLSLDPEKIGEAFILILKLQSSDSSTIAILKEALKYLIST